MVRKRRKKKKVIKNVAHKDGIIAYEDTLPLPFVLYPGFYGAFFAFKEAENAQEAFFCTCAQEAIQNYITIRIAESNYNNVDPNRRFILDSMHFPLSIVENLRKSGVEKNETIINHLLFKEKICHECNIVVPSYSYCVPMYGGVFKQTYGWYIMKQSYEWGITRTFVEKAACPQEILDIMDGLPQDQEGPIDDYDKEYGKRTRKIWKIIENEVRRKFNHKEIGSSWTSETILYSIILKLFPGKTILRHYRPEFLGGLELDIFIKELNLGIEYQGLQHYQPVKHWGGEEAFKRLKERDARKKILCKKEGIHLREFTYKQDLGNDLIAETLREFLES